MPFLGAGIDNPDTTSINEFVRDDYYTRFLGIGDFVPDGVATHVASSLGTSRWGFVQFPDAATSAANAQFYVPALWNSGTFNITGYLSNATATAGNVRMVVNMLAATSAESLSTSTSATNIVAAPGQHTFTTWSATGITVDGGDTLIFLRVLRTGADAADTFAGNIGFLGLKLTYLPSRR